MIYYDVELIDINENIENFKFSKVSDVDLDNIKKAFIEEKIFFEFQCLEGFILLSTKFFRGLMYTGHVELFKNTEKENKENSVEINNNFRNKNKEI